jgi:hypothetical protein
MGQRPSAGMTALVEGVAGCLEAHNRQLVVDMMRNHGRAPS